MKPRGMMVIHQFRPITNGAELQAERLAIRLAQRGHEMQVFTELRVPGSLPEEEIQGVKVHRVDFKMAYQILAGAENTFQYLAKTRKNYDRAWGRVLPANAPWKRCQFLSSMYQANTASGQDPA